MVPFSQNGYGFESLADGKNRSSFFPFWRLKLRQRSGHGIKGSDKPAVYPCGLMPCGNEGLLERAGQFVKRSFDSLDPNVARKTNIFVVRGAIFVIPMMKVLPRFSAKYAWLSLDVAAPE
jgi:hypothetical protein